MSTPAVALDQPGVVGRARGLFREPVGLPTLFAVCLHALATLWAYSWPGRPGMTLWIYLGLGWLALGGYWFVRLVGALVSGDSRSIRAHWVRWLVAPLVVVVTAALLITSVPLRARVLVDMDSMNAFALAAIENPDIDVPDRVGSFAVERFDTFDGGMRFLVEGTGFVDPYGFAYSPDREPPRVGEDTYSHLTGPWYLWEESW